MKPAKILLVDDDRNFLRVLTYHIQGLGYQAVPVSSAREALAALKEHEPELAVTDLRMPEMDGLQLLGEVKKLRPDMPVIVLTAHGSIDKAVEAIKAGAYDFIAKPFEKEQVRHTIANALRMADLVAENRRLSQVVSRSFEFGGIVGSSKKFREVLDLAQQLAGVDTTVLIYGESGTGKELLARAIHYNSDRRGRPFVVINCGAIPKDLIESELFGYRKGAFTGAVSDKKGKFEAADSGTVFLDEVGELPAEMQVKLLRVLQEREADIIGDPMPVRLDLRVLAATSRDLHAMMAQKAFREDLYYRLSVAPLHLPPLRERKDDIPLLVHSFLDKYNRKFGKEVAFDEAAIAALQDHDWPGNVRELESIVERLVVFDRSGRVACGNLPPYLQRPVKAAGKLVIQLPDEGFSLEEAERDILVAALEKHGWNQTRAARYLGMTRNTLIYRMQKYQIRESGGGSLAV